MATTKNTKAKGAKEQRSVGWKNEFTKIFVWELDNNKSLKTIWRGKLNDVCKENKQYSARVANFEKFLINLAQFFKPTHSISNAFYVDLINQALEEIDYLEIAEAYVGDFEAHDNALTISKENEKEWQF